MFRLFMGSFDTIINEPECGSITLLKHKLEHFYSRVSIFSSMYLRPLTYSSMPFKIHMFPTVFTIAEVEQ